MTASEKSFIGLAKQTSKGTPNTTDASFDYMLITQGGVGPQSTTLPLDQEIGGGALLRSVDRVGVVSMGAFEFIPRPKTLGHLLLGALGTGLKTGAAVPYTHTFKLPADQFDAPYFTVRQNVGGLWGETFQDMRVQTLAINWRSQNFVRAQARLLGTIPTPSVSTSGWGEAAKVDGRVPFLTTAGVMELPDGTALKCIGGSFVANLDIPLEEQFIVGSAYPDALDINSRNFIMNLTLKVEAAQAALYNKLLYDGAGGSAWAVDMMREGIVDIQLKGGKKMSDNATYPTLKIFANNQTGALGNLVLSSEPVFLRSGRQILLNVQAVFLADSTYAPIQIDLINDVSTAY